MKKLTVIILFSLIALTANAQIEKGNVQLSGTFVYANSDFGANDFQSFSFSPQAGLFLSDKTSLGVLLGYNSTGSSNSKTNIFTFGAFARFYKPVADRFYLFAQPQLTIGTGETGASEDISTFSISARGGLSYFFTDKLSMDMSLTAISYSSEEVGANSTDIFSVNFNPASVGIGITFLLK